MTELIDKPLKDSGERRDFGTGAIRDVATGKGNFSLLNPMVQWRLAKHFEKGAKKYSARNWEKGIPYSTYLDSAQRHMTSFQLGMDDEDHLIAWLWNVYCLIATEEMIKRRILPKSLNDLPDYREKPPITFLSTFLGKDNYFFERSNGGTVGFKIKAKVSKKNKVKINRVKVR